MQKVKELIIKTKEKGVFQYDNVTVDVADKSFLIVYLTDNCRVCFPLTNVIVFEICPEV